MMNNVFERPLLVDRVVTKSHYDVLGVSRDATQPEIQSKFDELISAECQREGGGNAAALEMLSEAYTILSVPRARQEYDDARTGTVCSPTPAPSLSRQRVEADIARRLEQRRRQMQETGRQQRRRLQEGEAKGIANATLVGSHKAKSPTTSKSVSEFVAEKSIAEKSIARTQWAKIHDIKVKARARSHVCDSTAASRAQFGLGDPTVIEKAREDLKKDASSRRLKKAAAEKKARLAADTRAQWKRIEEIKIRGASRERRFH